MNKTKTTTKTTTERAPDASTPAGAAKERLKALIEGIRVAILVTTGENGRPHGRPMYTQEAKFDGHVWFATSDSSTVAAEVRANPIVQLSYSSPGGEKYVSLVGEAQLLNDREKIQELWTPFMKAWFEGPDDPSLRLIRVKALEAQYWDSPGGKVGSWLSIAKSIVTGKHDDDGGYAHVSFE